VAVVLAAVIVVRSRGHGSPPTTIAGLTAPTAVHVVDETNGGAGVRLAWTDHSDGRLQQVLYVYRDRGTSAEATHKIEAGQTDTAIAIDPNVPYCFVVATVVPGSPDTYMNADPFCIRGASAVIAVPTT
jgi:hypothetical protein